MNLPQVLYANALRAATPAYSGAIVAGFEPANAVDWRDFSLFRPAAGNSTFDVTMTADTPVSSAVLWLSPAAGATATAIEFQYESSPGVYTTLTAVASYGSQIQWFDFAPVTILAGRKARIAFTGISGTMDIRQATMGAPFQFETGQWVGVNPTELTQGVVAENVISVNGSIIARNVRRVEATGNIALTYVTEAWVRAVWEPFAKHATRYPFWFRWAPVQYPTAVAFAAATEIVAPKNSMPVPRMEVSMPIRFIV
jgi:hypothetical protein